MKPLPAASAAGRTARNAIAAVAQVAVTGVLFFLLYRYLLDAVGAARLGVWSLVLASTNVSRLGGLGLQGTAVRFVARYLARGEAEVAARAVETAMLSTAAVIAIGVVAGYPLFDWFLQRLVGPEEGSEAHSVLPFALASLWLGMLGSVAQSGLDGVQRADVRSATTIGANLLYVLGAIAIVPVLGLVGLAIAQLAQSLFQTVIAWHHLRGALPELRRVPRTWDRRLFGEMVRYGANVQAESLLAMLHDPITKALLSRFGGLAAVGYFEMASRLVLQIRGLLTSGFQVLVPVIAECHESEPERIPRLYTQTSRLLIYVSAPVFGAVVAASPLIGRLWLGRAEPLFVAFLEMLAAGWLVNALSAPAMMVNFGTGRIGGHTVAALLIAALNVVFGVALGWMFGGSGVVLGWTLALVAGSALVCVGYHRRTATSFGALFPRDSRLLLAASLAAATAAVVVPRLLGAADQSLPVDMAVSCAFGLAVAAPAWANPTRLQLLERLAGLRAVWR